MREGAVQDFKLFMDDDAALLKAADAQWAVTPLTSEGRMGTEPTTEPAVMICDGGVVTVGAHSDCNIIVTGTAVSSFWLHPLHRLLLPDAVVVGVHAVLLLSAQLHLRNL